MARRFEVRVLVCQVVVYRVDLEGTADPEVAAVDWLALTEDLDPVSGDSSASILSAREVLRRGQ